MSVDCRVITGLTLEFAKDLDHAAFKKYHEFVEKYPELDEYTYVQFLANITRNLWSSVICHACHNAIVLLAAAMTL